MSNQETVKPVRVHTHPPIAGGCSCDDLIAERDSLRAINAELVQALREIRAVAEKHACICGPESPADHWGQCPRYYRISADIAIAKAEGR